MGPDYYYDFNAAADANRDRAALRRLSAPQIGTVIDSSVFMRIDVAAAWRAYHRRHRETAAVPRHERHERARTTERERERERESSDSIRALHGVAAFQFPASRDRFKATDAPPTG